MADSDVPVEGCPDGLLVERLSLQDKRTQTRRNPDLLKAPHDFAFAFDIDGVLLRGKVPLPGAKQALEALQTNSIPFILLTNGGGLTEAGHASRVGQRLTMEIKEAQFVQSHTPFKMFVDQYKDDWILVLGGHRHTVKELAAMYGFKKERIITTSDVTKHHPSIHPFPEMTTAYHDEYGNILDDFSQEQEITAILVFTSPRDWCLDLQICLDLLLSSRGRLGTRSPLNGDPNLPNYGYQQDGQPKLFFCNPDLEWATPHSIPRLAQGGFRAALEGVWAAATKGTAKLEAWTCGKPTAVTYQYAEKVLEEYHRKAEPDPENHIKTVYMIGDNPESDICGALSADDKSHLTWRSCLVETGVHRSGTVPAYPPTKTASNVWEAVRWAVEKETKVDIGPLEDG
ncbi:hypothetical protein VPNG_00917 [Cytospora leucostoma]|uniref:HAD-superfamily subfamily IIA hydrolase n=1 Tax=Cytospora leucostoma TaxID=1230097 RepID=A0A423XMI4_9PEZI|nr:hypothetical protein VPNG_00917 [Cytospora leucostoma]